MLCSQHPMLPPPSLNPFTISKGGCWVLVLFSIRYKILKQHKKEKYGQYKKRVFFFFHPCFVENYFKYIHKYIHISHPATATNKPTLKIYIHKILFIS